MGGTAANSLEQCIASCDATLGCVDVALSGAACYMKSSVGAAVQNGVLGARLVRSMSTLASSSSSSTPSSISATTTGSSTRSSAVPTVSQTPISCPGSNNTVYTTAGGSSFVVECGIDHQ